MIHGTLPLGNALHRDATLRSSHRAIFPNARGVSIIERSFSHHENGAITGDSSPTRDAS
jgi:hypothetical protein